MKSVGSQQFRRRSDLWTCSCGGSSGDGRSERVNEGVDCGVKIACRLSLRTQCCSTLLCPVRYSVQWSGTGSPEMVGFKWVDGLTSHPLHMPSFQLLSSDAALCNWPELGWLIRRSPGSKVCLHFFKPLFAEPILLLQRAYKQPRIITTSSSSLYMYLHTVAWHFPLLYSMARVG
jgi:hypothetical protein